VVIHLVRRLTDTLGLPSSSTMLVLAAVACASLRPELAWAELIIHVTPSADPRTTLADLENNRAAAVTLTQALSILKASALRDAKGALKEDITIRLGAGTYSLSETLVIDAASSGSARRHVTIEGPEGASAIVSGSRMVSAFTPVADRAVLAVLPEAARQNVLQADLAKQGISDYGEQARHGFGNDAGHPTAMEVFYRDRPMTLARWPNHGFAKTVVIPDAENGRTFSVQGAHLEAWRDEPHLLATGYWFHNWADATIPIEAIDTGARRVTLAAPGSPYGLKAGQPVFFQNALAELDQPGEWYLDRAKGVLYFWPPRPLRNNEVEVSMLARLLVIDGASHILVRRITFQNVRGDAITVSGGHHVAIASVVIRNVGNRGAVISGQSNGVSDALVEDIGEAGVVLAGGDRQTLAPGNLYVDRSTIRRFSRVSRTYQPAILMSGVGNRAMSNEISDAPHVAILFSGNDHLISSNEIFFVCKETDDAGAIYTGRDWTARGTVITKNHIHDINNSITDVPKKFGVMGIYLDDQASGINVNRNLFERVRTGVYIGGGRDNHLDDNTFVNTPTAIHLDARGKSWNRVLTDEPNGPLRKRLREVPYNQAPYKECYAHLAKILEDEPGAPKYNTARRNRFGSGAKIEITKDAEGGISIDGQSQN
jgi:hypothetical protein